MLPKGAHFRKIEPWLGPLAVLLVGAGAFGLGRLSLPVPEPAALPATPAAFNAPVQSRQAEPGGGVAGEPAGLADGAYVASKNGSKYYLTSCSGANRIKEENKVYFGSAAEAKAAGYGPAANCPGL
jgi:hypothetical protein